MKKVIIILLFVAVIAAALFQILRPEGEDGIRSFRAVVVQLDEHSILAEGLPENEESFQGRFSLFISSATAVPWEMPEVGDTILVSFTGPVQESSPAQIPTVNAIEILRKGSMQSVSHDSFKASFVRVDGNGEGLHTLFPMLENGDTLYESSVQHLPIVKLDSTDLLRDFMQRAADSGKFFSLEEAHDEGGSFAQRTAHCDEAFFRENTLLIVYVSEPSGSVRHEISALNIENGGVFVGVRRLIPEFGTDDVAGWFAVLEVPNDLLTGCTSFDAAIDPGE